MPSEAFLRWITLCGVALALLATAIGFLFGPSTALSLALGSALALGNFLLLIHLGRRLLSPGRPRSLLLLFGLKFSLFVGLVFALVVWLSVKPLPFLLGVSVILGALMLGVFFGPSPGSKEAEAPQRAWDRWE